MTKTVVQRWHTYAETQDFSLLNELIADDAVFHSPVVHTPQEGKKKCMMYLMGAMQVFSQGSFKYVGEWNQSNGVVLEFESEIDGIKINGVDLISWNDEDKIVEFKVLVRPLKGMQKIHEKMQAMLESMA